MTTLEPGASVVLTQGLRASPASTAFLASSAAPTMTDGLEVFVQDVMAAITTAPWSMVTSVPSSSVTVVGADGRDGSASPGDSSTGAWSPVSTSVETGSDAGNVSATPLPVSGTVT